MSRNGADLPCEVIIFIEARREHLLAWDKIVLAQGRTLPANGGSRATPWRTSSGGEGGTRHNTDYARLFFISKLTIYPVNDPDMEISA